MASDDVLTLDSATLYTAAYNSLFTKKPPSVSLPLPSLPSSIPIPKFIPQTRFIIDGFKYAGKFSVSYFLSHFHSDHYTGLSPNWSRGIIYCSPITARLLAEVLKVSSSFVVALPLSERILIDGSEVFLIDANHCPGAVQFLFKVPGENGNFARYIHTGDFRYCDSMKSEPSLSEFIGADAVFLDTTYCNPKFVFPCQEESIDYIVRVIGRSADEGEGIENNILFLIATYIIGKEKILIEISRRCKRKILVDSWKLMILNVLGYGEDGIFTKDESESNVHVVGWNVLGATWPYFRPNFGRLKEVMTERGYSKVVGFVPTGWTYEVKHNKFAVRKKDEFEIHLVPYSEHSNYDELREYVKFLKPKRVIPTVGVDIDRHDSKQANSMRKHFSGLVDEMAIKQDFLTSFLRVVQEVGAKDYHSVSDSLLEHEIAGISSDPKGSKHVVLENVSPSYPPQEPITEDPEIANEDNIEKYIQELQDCLPSWVNRSQMLDLLRSSRGNVIDAVSNFYERETEFLEQVNLSASSACLIQESSPNMSLIPFQSQREPAVFSKLLLSSAKCWTTSDGISLSQSCKLPNMANTNKRALSSGKRKRNPESRSSKKAIFNSNMEYSGQKQCTITKFFSKKVPAVCGDEEIETTDKHCNNDEVILPKDTVEQYREEVDQFIQIVNGGESERRSAATILEKTKGDINMALDMYFSDSKSIINESKENHQQSCNLMSSQCNMETFSSGRDAKALKELGKDSNVPFVSLPTDITTANYISLPADTYSPIGHACWTSGEPAPYIHLARSFELVEEEKGKIKATSMLCNMFRSLLALSPEDVLPAVYLCTNKIAPEHENMELNIGGSIVVAALEEACGTNRSRIRDLYNSLGDLGDVAQLCRQTQSLLAPPPALTIRGVYSTLRKISVQTGSGSTTRKKILIVNLMRSCREKEMKFIVRTLVRNLRIGAMMRTILPALAQAIIMNSNFSGGVIENLKDQLQILSAAVIEAYNIIPNLDLLIPSLLDKGINFSSTTLRMVPGIPIKPMLAKITNGIPQVLKLFHNKAFTCEYKYDGQRAQIHKLADGSVHIFSRNGDETTSRFPDLVNIILESCAPAAVTFIMDAEVVAIDRKSGSKLMSFQELSSRERGSKDSLVSLHKIKVDVCLFVFDIMLANGQQLLSLPLRQRRKYLKDLFGDGKLGYFDYAREITVEADDAFADNEATLTRMNTFLDEALHSSCEGIMVKLLDVDAGYIPSKRSDAWLKVKRDYVEGLSDSLDLVPIGAWYGNGRKAGWYSPFLMACYNPETEEFQSVCRVMSGFSDSFYTEMKEFFSGDKILVKKPPYYHTAEMPDLWFSPELVWEIKGSDFTVSPVHHAAIGFIHPDRGISIRFPRFICTVSDRKPEDCSTSVEIAEMFHSQTRKMDVSRED